MEKNISALQEFQAKNKYLFMMYSPENQVILWQMIAAYDKGNIDDILKSYGERLQETFYEIPKKWKIINAFTHIFWFFKKSCSAEEKKFFLEMVDVFQEGRIPTSSVINILKTWALRENDNYILQQTIFHPFPSKLIELKQSWKNLDL